MNSSINKNTQSIDEMINTFLDYEKPYIKLYRFFGNFCKEQNRIILFNARYGPIFYFQKYELQLFIVISFLFGKKK